MIGIRQGQISIDYTGGALLFFLSIIFVVSGIVGTIPEYSNVIQRNSVEVSAWRISTTLLSEPGYWQQGNDGGTAWEEHDLEAIRSIGLAGDNGLARSKIQALADLPYAETKNEKFRTEKDFLIDFTEYLVVDTAKQFNRTFTPPKLDGRFEPPTHSSYSRSDAEVHYGSAASNSDRKYFLVTAHNDTYDTVYYSDSWDFSGAEPVTAGDLAQLSFNDRIYVLELSEAGVTASEGKTVVVRRGMGAFGNRAPAEEDTVVSVERYANMGDKLVKMEMQVWGG